MDTVIWGLLNRIIMDRSAEKGTKQIQKRQISEKNIEKT